MSGIPSCIVIRILNKAVVSVWLYKQPKSGIPSYIVIITQNMTVVSMCLYTQLVPAIPSCDVAKKTRFFL